jgi:CheY-like chemotaxis protein
VSSRRILVVEDDAAIREMLSEILTGEGYLIDQAANGRDAVLKLKRVRPDVVLLDLMMPVMDGPTFARACGLLDHGAGIPIVIMSASPGLARMADQLRAYGVHGELCKPFDVDDLLRTIQRVLERRPTARSYPTG